MTTTTINDNARINPAFAGALSTTTNNDCRDFMAAQLVGIVAGSDEWMIKLDSLAHLGELTTREIYQHCKRANKDKPQDAYRQRLAQLGLWPKSLKGTTMKPVNEKDCAERGGQYKTRAKIFECLRKMASADKKALELAKADEAARAKGFANAAAKIEHEEEQARLTALKQDKEEALRLDNEAIAAGFKNAAAKIEHEGEQARLTALAEKGEDKGEDKPIKIATGPSNADLLAQGRELLRRLAVESDSDDIVAGLVEIFDRVQGVVAVAA